MDWITPQLIQNEFITQINGISITIKREDQHHPFISGNKFRKLKYNFEQYMANEVAGVATFGGAYSNHLAATAAMANRCSLPCLGFVRGDELAKTALNPTLKFCVANGMKLIFLSREEYRKKENASLVKQYINQHSFVVLPEGGTNDLAIKGCKEILTKQDEVFDAIAVAVGTGGTFLGLHDSCTPNQHLLGFKAVNDPKVDAYIENNKNSSKAAILIDEFILGGYGKVPDALVEFINNFNQTHQILLDPTYTGKMLFGIFTLIKNKAWCWGKNVLVIHTGGTQAIEGFNLRQKLKYRPCIRP